MMVSYKNDQTLAVPIAEAVHHLRFVDPSDQMVETAREIGIRFGTEERAWQLEKRS
jgi:hypothetical protein